LNSIALAFNLTKSLIRQKLKILGEALGIPNFCDSDQTFQKSIKHPQQRSSFPGIQPQVVPEPIHLDVDCGTYY
jgi:hypothetical protein